MHMITNYELSNYITVVYIFIRLEKIGRFGREQFFSLMFDFLLPFYWFEHKRGIEIEMFGSSENNNQDKSDLLFMSINVFLYVSFRKMYSKQS
jgi:hypothetical protein